MKKGSLRYDVVVACLLFLLAIPAQHFEWFALVEDQTLTFRHQLRMAYGDPQQLTINPDIVLVNTDEDFFSAYASFPLRRTDIASIIANLHALGAKVIAVDLLMDFPSSYGEDPPLAEVLAASENVMLVSQAQFVDGRYVGMNRPAPLLDQAAPSAYTNISSNSTLLTTLSRLRIHPEIAAEPNGWPFAVQAAAMYLGVEPRLDGTDLYLGDIKVRLDHDYHLPIDFPALPTGTRFLSQSAGIGALEFLDISDLDEYELRELSYWVRDKIVLIGDTSEVSHDWFDTPVGMVYGVEIIAGTIHSLLAGGPLQAPPPLVQAAIVLAVLALMAVPMAMRNPLGRGVVVAVILLGFMAAVTFAYVRLGSVVPMSYTVLALVLSYLLIEYRHYLVERDQKKQIAKTFGQYIPAELVDEMNRKGEPITIGGESREMTVLFSDVRGFTTISEGLAPPELTALMNAFLSPMTRIIHHNRGTIDKYMGDAIMAFWGAPLNDAEHARHAVKAALDMRQGMEDLSDSFVARGWKPLKVGIGLNTGVMNVGNMGSDFRLAYTVLGDAVNLGSRIESLTKQYGIDIMISEYTLAAVPDLVARELDLIRVKGKEDPVRVFEPIGFRDEISPAQTAHLDEYHQALKLYRAQDWQGAHTAFTALAEVEPGRMIHRIYLERIACFKAEPPGDDWDGVFTFQTK